MLNAAEDSKIQQALPLTSQIRKNNFWVMKTNRPDLQDGEAQYEDDHQEVEVQTEPETGVVHNTKRSLFRQKFVQDWRKIENSMPHRVGKLGKSATKLN